MCTHVLCQVNIRMHVKSTQLAYTYVYIWQLWMQRTDTRSVAPFLVFIIDQSVTIRSIYEPLPACLTGLFVLVCRSVAWSSIRWLPAIQIQWIPAFPELAPFSPGFLFNSDRAQCCLPSSNNVLLMCTHCSHPMLTTWLCSPDLALSLIDCIAM